ncbi:Uncharacterized membrane-associated protein [Enterobacter cancerogenus]|uniref:Uncharacterized membrane-associated protein n=1 Tax=Enterobacter cancerogenus TaxID=69218 RepID=A0A484X6H1_9ENTR|nr:Uncharacterized membrane-associated protein [Enterobacter cancerogenus]
MAWLDNLLNHFAHYPAHLFALLFAMALAKSTVIVSSVLPPASVMLIAGIAAGLSSLHPGLAWLAVALGAALGSVLNYHLGQRMGNTRTITPAHRKTCRYVFARAAPAAEKRRPGAVHRALSGGTALYRPADRRYATTERRQSVSREPDFSLRLGSVIRCCGHGDRDFLIL